MKVIANGGHGKSMTVEAAIKDKLYPDPYTYGGELEKIKSMVELQSEMMATLIERLVERRHLNKRDVEALLGYSYEVEEE